jgi:hypothetical protein
VAYVKKAGAHVTGDALYMRMVSRAVVMPRQLLHLSHPLFGRRKRMVQRTSPTSDDPRCRQRRAQDLQKPTRTDLPRPHRADYVLHEPGHQLVPDFRKGQVHWADKLILMASITIALGHSTVHIHGTSNSSPSLTFLASSAVHGHDCRCT